MIFNGLSDVNFGGGVQIATGSYVGTGTYGANNPNILTFDFEAMIVFIKDTNGFGILAQVDPSVSLNYGYRLFLDSASGTFGNFVGEIVTFRGKTVSWYNTGSGIHQMNKSGTIYTYYALGTGGGATESPAQLTARVIAADVSNPYTILNPRGITYEFVEQVGNQYRYSFTVTPGTIQLASSSTATGTMGVKFEFIDATPSGQFEESPYTALQVAIPESNRVNGEYTFTCLMDEKISPFNNSFGFKVTPL